MEMWNRMLKGTIIFCAALLLAFGPARGQDAAEAPSGWTGDAGLSLSLTRGNSDTTNVNLSYSVKRPFAEDFEFISTGYFLLSRIDGVTSAESLGLTGRMNRAHSERFFSYSEVQGLRDRFKNYDSRFLPGLGVGYKAYATETAELSLSAGMTGVFTKYHDSGDTDAYAGINLGDKLTVKLSPTAEFSQVLVWNSDVSDLNHYFLRLELNLAAAVSKRLALKLSMIDSYDNEPVGAEVKKNDLAFLSGLSLKF